ncbi:hypothetical protein ACJ73_01734 [Blastomyces percursus]|uniref:Myb/SANT-like domain-containing protein n=1 Tax=Blastomyces percursus TaxID=1658174 RepID=A0A1J9QDH0_9EURO|nr:hypothetical protein ACJ73_01734 [Blastomyces percursus]
MPGSQSPIINEQFLDESEEPISSNQWPTSPSPSPTLPATVPAPPPAAAMHVIVDEDYSTQLTVSPALQSFQSAFQSASQSISWSSTMDKAMLLGLLDAKKDGWETDNGNFKIHGWNIAVQAVRRVTHQNVNKNNLENRWRSNKRIWRLWMKHKNQISGWTWCAERETYINDPEVMDEYFRRHPDMILFQHQGPAFREQHEQLLDGKLATGQYAVGSQAMRRQLDTDEDLYPPSSLVSSPASKDLPQLSATVADSSALESSPAPKIKRLRKGKNEMYAESISGLSSVLLEMNKEIVNSLREVTEKAPEKATRLFLQEVNQLLLDDWKDSGGHSISAVCCNPMSFCKQSCDGSGLSGIQ